MKQAHKLIAPMNLVGEFRIKRFYTETEAFADLVQSYGFQYAEADLRAMGWQYVAA